MPEVLPLPNASLALPSGRSVEVEPGPSERVVIRGRDGSVEVAIRFTADGPVLAMTAVALDLDAKTEVAVRCHDFTVRAEGTVQIDAGGDSIAKAGGVLYTEASEVATVSRDGDIELQAEGDAVVRGDRVRLNC